MKKTLLPAVIYVCLVLGYSCGTGHENLSIATDSLSMTQGKLLFQKNCSGCHNFRQDGIGPNLAGVAETDSLNRLRLFIHSPKTLIDQGDERAKKLLARYHTVMPSFAALNDEQTDQLIAYLHAQKAGKKPAADPNAIKDPFPEKIAASGIQTDLDFIAQIPASSEKEPLTRISKMDWVPALKTWFVLDQRGKLYRLVNGKASLWLDMQKEKPAFINEPGLATGFGSFAFHPDFARNGLFYTTHSEAPHTKKADFSIPDTISQVLQWVLCEWKISGPASAPSLTSRELIRMDMVAGIHGVQEIIFNDRVKKGDADYGNLYIGVGDGGAVENGYPFLTDHPQKIWGSILRIDPLGRNSVNGQYGIPSSNPYTGYSDSNTVREIYADGFRNPNRISWTKKGIMLATNIGQARVESINIILKGHHYGWPKREGPFAIRNADDIDQIFPLPAGDSAFQFTYPVAAYDHDEGNAIGGGFEYNGKNIPQLRGKYMFGDIPTGRLFFVNLSELEPGKLAAVKEWFVALHGKRLTLRELCGQNRVDLRFARDAQGEIYIFTKPDGKIYRLSKLSKPIPDRSSFHPHA